VKEQTLPKVIAVVPVFNEHKTLKSILKRIAPRVDVLVCVNDGSKDDSLRILKAFAKKRRDVFGVDLPFNTGMAGAIKQGLLFTLYLEKVGFVKADDVVVTIDADGQHKPEYIPTIVKYLTKKKVDVVLTRRDFSVYPLYKIWGNRFLTWTNSILSGFKYYDVESGLRFLKVKTIGSILKFYTGMKYSCAQEIALISAREGFKIDNDFVVEIAYYRPGTTIWDGFIVLFLSFFTFLRWRFRLESAVSCDSKMLKTSFNLSKGYWPKPKKWSSK
jgi:glycosyltransferase involved in cell wall biosynthesis